MRNIPGDPRIAIPVVVMVILTLVSFGVFLGTDSAGDDLPAASVGNGSGDDIGAGAGTNTPTEQPQEQPTATPSGECSPVQADDAADWLAFPQRNAERMFSKEGYKFNYHLYWPDHVEAHGIAIERPGSNSDCFEDRFFCSWSGQSARDGFDDAGFPPDSQADKRLHFGVIGFLLPEKESDGYGTTWPYETFSYVAYARTMDGTYLTTPIDDATLGDGLVEVRYHNKGNNAGEAIQLCDPIAAGVVQG